MKFVIADISYLESVGFDTSEWRKSLDGAKALGHIEWVQILIPDVLTNVNCSVYENDSAEFQALINSQEWTSSES